MKMRISQEINEFSFSMNTQVQRAIDNAFNDQIIPKIQSKLRATNGDRPREGPDINAGGLNRVATGMSSTIDVSESLNPEKRPRAILNYILNKRN